MSKIKEWFANLWQGFVDWLVAIIIIILTWIKDLFLLIFELIIDGLVFIFELLTPPEFLAGGMDVLVTALPPSVTYFLGQSGVAEGIAIYGAGVTFRLLRKLFTLGQW